MKKIPLIRGRGVRKHGTLISEALDDIRSVNDYCASRYGSGTKVVEYAIVDDVDFDVVSKYRWCLSNRGFVARNMKVDGVNHYIRMHQEVLGSPIGGDDRRVVHLNGNKLDNRRRNLYLTNKKPTKKEMWGKWIERCKKKDKLILEGYLDDMIRIRSIDND